MAVLYSTSKELRNRIEMLPPGPQWCSKEMETEAKTLKKVTLYYRDPLQCIQTLMSNPMHADHLDFTPYRVYKTVQKQVRLYSKWLSGDVAWQVQVRILYNAFVFPLININAYIGCFAKKCDASWDNPVI